MKNATILLSIILTFLSSIATAGDDPKPSRMALPKAASTSAATAGFSHKVGTLWTQVTNFGFYGDRNYEQPNFEWPGGSGNVYGWLTSIWIGGMVDSLGYVSYGEGNHFTPLDSIQVKYPSQGAVSAEDTYTRYTDMNPPIPSGIHKNLGVEVTERTYAWNQSYNDDFIICDYWIKYVVHDRNADGIIDAADSTLNGVYMAFRMDADVSGFLGPATASSLWDADDLVGSDSVDKLIYIYDTDSPIVAGNDTGNPDPATGILRSPGYIGVRMLYFDSTHFVGTYTGRPSMAVASYRNFEPLTSQMMYEFVKNNGITPVPTVTRDYRCIQGVGPFNLPAGDSIRVAVAWVIGYGANGIKQNSSVAQLLYDDQIRLFGLIEPSAPHLLIPADGSLIALDNLLFAWTSTSSEISRYWLEISSDSLFVSSVVDSMITNTSVSVAWPALGKFYWRVKALNNFGWGPFSVPREFTRLVSGVHNEAELPDRYILEDGYPNPFNPSTTIRYALPSRSHVTITVFNALGQQVTTLVNSEVDAGYHEVRFDASGLSSGVYLYRLQAGKYGETKKLLLLR